jgi:hypothetical protein
MPDVEASAFGSFLIVAEATRDLVYVQRRLFS